MKGDGGRGIVQGRAKPSAFSSAGRTLLDSVIAAAKGPAALARCHCGPSN